MGRTKEIVHNGKKIVHLDFANFVETKSSLEAIEEARVFVAKHPPNSVYTLTDCTNSRANEEIVNGLKALAKANKPFVKAGAVVGLSAIQRVLFKTVMAFSGRNLSAFATLDEAKEWLSKQS